MKKFRYSMESILNIKLKLEDQAKLAYANARSRLIAEEEKLEAMKRKRLPMNSSSVRKAIISLIL